MRNITLSADDSLIDQARKLAQAQHTTLNNLFRDWLADYVAPQPLSAEDIRKTVESVHYFRSGRTFSRDERNER